MNILGWNVQDLNSSVRFSDARNVVMNYKIGLVGLVETKLERRGYLKY